MSTEQINLYTDGGMFGGARSEIGGLWAWCREKNGSITKSASGILLCKGVAEPQECEGYTEETNLESMTNNITEMYAIYNGLLLARKDGYTRVKLHSDSGVSIGRLVKGWAWSGCPDWLRVGVQKAVLELELECVLLSGHPSKIELLRGVSSDRGHPVSEFNVWCDKECTRLRKMYENGVSCQTQKAQRTKMLSPVVMKNSSMDSPNENTSQQQP